MPRSRKVPEREREAARLRKLRATLGWSQRELAAEFKVAHGAVAGWESGKRTLPGPALRLLEIYEQELGMPHEPGLRTIQTSSAARNLALTRMAGNVLAHTAATAIGRMLPGGRGPVVEARAQAALARGVAEALGNLKGLAMKTGQLLAYVDFTLPDAARAELRTLLTSSRPMSAVAVADAFLQDFGKLPREIFAQWSPEPFAAASIGQVHSARLHSGEDVAVKVQYPRIVEAIEADLRSSVAAGRVGGLLFRGQQPDEFIEEVRDRMLEECDYLLEADRQEAFRKLWLGRPGLRIPRVYTEHCSRRVFVSELCPGETCESLAEHGIQAARDRAGALLFRFAAESLFYHGHFQADPHPGNLVFRGGDLVLLDFGCVKRLPATFLTSMRETLRAYLERDFGRARCLLQATGIAPQGGCDFDYVHRMVLKSYQYLLLDGAFSFSSDYVKAMLRFCVLENPDQFRMRLPREFIFANRLLLGLVAVLARLRACVDARSVVLELLYEPGRPRPMPFTRAELARFGPPFQRTDEG